MKNSFIIFVLSLVVGCGSNTPDESYLRKNSTEITLAARELLQSEADLTISSAPKVIANLNPLRIYKEAGGLFIRTSESFAEEEGVFIPNDPTAIFDESTDPSFEKVTEGLYYYRIKG